MRVWDAAAGQETLALKGHANACDRRGVQPRRPATRLRLRGQDGAGLGRRLGQEVLALKGHTGGCSAWRSARTAAGSPPPPGTGRCGCAGAGSSELDHLDILESMNDLANRFTALGWPAEALKLYEQTRAIRKAKQGPDHPNTLASMIRLAQSLFALDRPSESVTIIDACLSRIEGKLVDPRLVPLAFGQRLRAFARQKDRPAAGRRQCCGKGSTVRTPTVYT